MSLIQAASKSFQLEKSILMSKAHELSSQCDAEVLLIVGKESKYFAYSSFDRAESMRTVLVRDPPSLGTLRLIATSRNQAIPRY